MPIVHKAPCSIHFISSVTSLEFLSFLEIIVHATKTYHENGGFRNCKQNHLCSWHYSKLLLNSACWYSSLKIPVSLLWKDVRRREPKTYSKYVPYYFLAVPHSNSDRRCFVYQMCPMLMNWNPHPQNYDPHPCYSLLMKLFPHYSRKALKISVL